MSIDPIVRRLQETPRRKRLWYGVAVVGVVAVVIFALNAVYGFVGGASSTTGSQRTVTVARGTVQSSVTASGNVSVARSAAANFSTSGTVTSVKVKVGDVVTAGQQLATLDSAAAEANLETAKANLAQAEATLASAQGGATAEQQASNASSLHQAQVQVTTAKQQLEADQKALATAQQQLADSKKLDCPPTSSSSAASSSSSPSSSASSQSNASSTQSSQTGGLGSDELERLEPFGRLHAYRVVDRARLRERRKRIGGFERRLRVLREGAARRRRVRPRRTARMNGRAVVSAAAADPTGTTGQARRRPRPRPRPRPRRPARPRRRARPRRSPRLAAALNGTVDPGRARHELPLPVRNVADDLARRRPRRRPAPARAAVPVTAAIAGSDARTELLVPGRRDQLVGHDQRRAEPLHHR